MYVVRLILRCALTLCSLPGHQLPGGRRPDLLCSTADFVLRMECREHERGVSVAVHRCAADALVSHEQRLPGFSFPLWSTFLAFVCILVNVGNEIRLCTRFSILRAAMSVYKHDPNNERPAVLITPVYKSAFLLPLVRQLREKEQQTAAHPVSDSQLRTRVIAVDTWRVAWREWAEENAVREHVYHFTEFRQQARNPHVFRLPVSDGEVEAIFAPFASYLPFCQDPGDNEHEQYQKLVIIVKVCPFACDCLRFVLPEMFTCSLQEFYRVLRPGGTLSSYNLFWKSSMFVRAVKEAGGFENVETGKKWYFPTAFPCHLTTMTKSTSSFVVFVVLVADLLMC